MYKQIIVAITGLLLFSLQGLALAENSTKVPGYTIHHNALTTDVLSSKVASAYHIRRSKNRALLNVSIIKDVPGTIGQAVPAMVRVHARYLTGYMRPITMRKIEEGAAIYYIGDFPVVHRDNLTFIIDVLPQGERRPFLTQIHQIFITQ